jgi:hypothetical protein
VAPVNAPGDVEPWNVASAGGEGADETGCEVVAAGKRWVLVKLLFGRARVRDIHPYIGRCEIKTSDLEDVIGRVRAVVCWGFAWDFERVGGR